MTAVNRGDTTVSARIRAALRERYPDGLTPTGAQSELAREFGTYASLVCQLVAERRRELLAAQATPRAASTELRRCPDCRRWRRPEQFIVIQRHKDDSVTLDELCRECRQAAAERKERAHGQAPH